MIIKKETPANNASVWTKNDRKQLKGMVKEGKTIKEIAEALGRTPAAVMYQKSTMGLSSSVKKKVKEAMKAKVKSAIKLKTKTGTIEVKAPVATEMSERDKAKEMASFARGVARANGKRITMAMFFVEDL
jgi:predicted transcriptional regulator